MSSTSTLAPQATCNEPILQDTAKGEMFPSFTADVQLDTISESVFSPKSVPHWDTYRDWMVPRNVSFSTDTTYNDHSDSPAPPPPTVTADCERFLQGKDCRQHKKGTCVFKHNNKVRLAAWRLRKQAESQETPITNVHKDGKAPEEIDTLPGNDKKTSTSGALAVVQANIPRSSKNSKNKSNEREESFKKTCLPANDFRGEPDSKVYARNIATKPEATNKLEVAITPEIAKQPDVATKREGAKKPYVTRKPEVTKEIEFAKEPELEKQPEVAKESGIAKSSQTAFKPLESSELPRKPQSPRPRKEIHVSPEAEAFANAKLRGIAPLPSAATKEGVFGVNPNNHNEGHAASTKALPNLTIANLEINNKLQSGKASTKNFGMKLDTHNKSSPINNKNAITKNSGMKLDTHNKPSPANNKNAFTKNSVLKLNTYNKSSLANNKLAWKKNPAWKASQIKLHEKYEQINEKVILPPIEFGITHTQYFIINTEDEPVKLQPVSFPINGSAWENDQKVQEFTWAKANLSPATVAKLMRTYLVKGRFADGSKPLTVSTATKGKGCFRRFNELPGEVRNLIWSMAIDALQIDCLVKQTCEIEYDGIQKGCRLKRMADCNLFLWALNREARSMALAHHELTFGNKFHSDSILFNYQKDRLFIVSRSDVELKDTVKNYFETKDRRRVKFLMVPLRNYLASHEHTMYAVTSFPYLEHVWFIVGDGKEEEPWSLCPKLKWDLGYHLKEMHKYRFRNLKEKHVPPVPKITLNVVPAQVAHDLKIDGCQWIH